MKVVVTGAGGMLAHALVPLLRARGHETVALDRAALDVADRAAVHARIAAERPDAVVQCAAYTAVDRAEEDEAEATRINAVAAGHVADACDRVGAAFVYPSTDYVFAGTATAPYRTGDAVDPVNAYGRSKLAGERAALAVEGGLVVRTSWLYGEGGSHFVDTILRLAREGKPLRVVDDQWGRPTWTGALAEALAALMETGARGIFHATGGGEPVSWCAFAREVVALGSPGARVVPVGSAEFPRPARRPAWSVLDCSATEERTRAKLPHWRDSLRRYMGAGA